MVALLNSGVNASKFKSARSIFLRYGKLAQYQKKRENSHQGSHTLQIPKTAKTQNCFFLQKMHRTTSDFTELYKIKATYLRGTNFYGSQSWDFLQERNFADFSIERKLEPFYGLFYLCFLHLKKCNLILWFGPKSAKTAEISSHKN